MVNAPYTYVTTQHFLSAFGLETLRNLPNIEALEDAGLLSRHDWNETAIPIDPGSEDSDETDESNANVSESSSS